MVAVTLHSLPLFTASSYTSRKAFLPSPCPDAPAIRVTASEKLRRAMDGRVVEYISFLLIVYHKPQRSVSPPHSLGRGVWGAVKPPNACEFTSASAAEYFSSPAHMQYVKEATRRHSDPTLPQRDTALRTAPCHTAALRYQARAARQRHCECGNGGSVNDDGGGL